MVLLIVGLPVLIIMHSQGEVDFGLRLFGTILLMTVAAAILLFGPFRRKMRVASQPGWLILYGAHPRFAAGLPYMETQSEE